MEERLRLFTKDFIFNKGASESSLEQAQIELKLQLPRDYLQFLRQSNGAEGPIGKANYLVIWSIEEVIEQYNEENHQDFYTDLVIFAGNGANAIYAFNTKMESLPIVELDWIGWGPEEAKTRAETFFDFLEYVYNSED